MSEESKNRITWIIIAISLVLTALSLKQDLHKLTQETIACEEIEYWSIDEQGNLTLILQNGNTYMWYKE